MVMDKLKDKAGEVKGAALEKFDKTLDELNEALPTIEALGFAVTDLKVGIGPTPEVSAKISGSVEGIKAEEIQGLIDSNPDKKFLVTILKGLQTASDVQNKLGDLGFKSVEADVNVLAPSIKVGFLK